MEKFAFRSIKFMCQAKMYVDRASFDLIYFFLVTNSRNSSESSRFSEDLPNKMRVTPSYSDFYITSLRIWYKAHIME